jgi:hypothetical protein
MEKLLFWNQVTFSSKRTWFVFNTEKSWLYQTLESFNWIEYLNWKFILFKNGKELKHFKDVRNIYDTILDWIDENDENGDVRNINDTILVWIDEDNFEYLLKSDIQKDPNWKELSKITLLSRKWYQRIIPPYKNWYIRVVTHDSIWSLVRITKNNEIIEISMGIYKDISLPNKKWLAWARHSYSKNQVWDLIRITEDNKITFIESIQLGGWSKKPQPDETWLMKTYSWYKRITKDDKIEKVRDTEIKAAELWYPNKELREIFDKNWYSKVSQINKNGLARARIESDWSWCFIRIINGNNLIELWNGNNRYYEIYEPNEVWLAKISNQFRWIYWDFLVRITENNEIIEIWTRNFSELSLPNNNWLARARIQSGVSRFHECFVKITDDNKIINIWHYDKVGEPNEIWLAWVKKWDKYVNVKITDDNKIIELWYEITKNLVFFDNMTATINVTTNNWIYTYKNQEICRVRIVNDCLYLFNKDWDYIWDLPVIDIILWSITEGVKWKIQRI